MADQKKGKVKVTQQVKNFFRLYNNFKNLKASRDWDKIIEALNSVSMNDKANKIFSTLENFYVEADKVFGREEFKDLVLHRGALKHSVGIDTEKNGELTESEVETLNSYVKQDPINKTNLNIMSSAGSISGYSMIIDVLTTKAELIQEMNNKPETGLIDINEHNEQINIVNNALTILGSSSKSEVEKLGAIRDVLSVTSNNYIELSSKLDNVSEEFKNELDKLSVLVEKNLNAKQDLIMEKIDSAIEAFNSIPDEKKIEELNQTVFQAIFDDIDEVKEIADQTRELVNNASKKTEEDIAKAAADIVNGINSNSTKLSEETLDTMKKAYGKTQAELFAKVNQRVDVLAGKIIEELNGLKTFITGDGSALRQINVAISILQKLDKSQTQIISSTSQLYNKTYSEVKGFRGLTRKKKDAFQTKIDDIKAWGEKAIDVGGLGLENSVVERIMTQASDDARAKKASDRNIKIIAGLLGVITVLGIVGGSIAIADFIQNKDNTNSNNGEMTFASIENDQLAYFIDKLGNLQNAASISEFVLTSDFANFVDGIVVNNNIVSIPSYNGSTEMSYDISNLNDKNAYTTAIKQIYSQTQNSEEDLYALIDAYSMDDIDGQYNSTEGMKGLAEMYENQEHHTDAEIQNAKLYAIIHAKLIVEYEKINGDGSSNGKSDVEMIVGIANGKGDTGPIIEAINNAYDAQFAGKEGYNPDASYSEKLEALKNMVQESHDKDTIENAEAYKQLLTDLRNEYEKLFGSTPDESLTAKELMDLINEELIKDIDPNEYMKIVDTLYNTLTGKDAAGLDADAKFSEIIKAIDELKADSKNRLEISKDLCAVFGIIPTDNAEINYATIYAILGMDYEDSFGPGANGDQPNVKPVRSSNGYEPNM